MTITPGQNVGSYRIIEQLGSGGMATVYKAYHPSLDRYVAIKILHPAFKRDPQFFERFKREARIVANLEHPNIIPVYDFNEHEGEPYLVMRYVEGDTLKGRMGDQAMAKDAVLRLIRPVCQALTYAHKQGILHRDIKPSNIMITNDGDIFITDFGLARMVEAGESTLSQDMMIGTPQYISPEQAQGLHDLDSRTDVYSLGVVLYEMLTGRVPFNADTPFATVHDHIYSPLPLPSDINPKIDTTVERMLLKALAKDRDDRYPAAADLLAALETTLGKSPLPAADPTIAKKTADKKSIPWWLWAGGAVMLLLCCALVGGALLVRLRNRQQPPVEPALGQVVDASPTADAPDASLPTADTPLPTDAPDAPLPTSTPNLPDAAQARNLSRQATAARRAGDLDEAARLYEAAIAADPSHLPAYFELSQMQRQQENRASSVATLEQAVAANPDSSSAWARLGETQLFAAREPEAALASFEEAAALAPDSATPYAGQALALLDMGQIDAAKEAIDTALALDPDNAGAQLANAFYLREQGNRPAALRQLRQLLLAPDIAPLIRERARQLLSQIEN